MWRQLGGRGKTLAAIVATLGVLGGVGIASALVAEQPSPQDASDVRPVEYTSRRAPVTIPSGPPDVLLGAVLSAYGGRAVLGADLAPFRRAVVPDNPGAEAVDGLEARFTVRAVNLERGMLRPLWEANLVAGALREMLHVQNTRLLSVRVAAVLPDGTSADHPNVLGDIAFGQSFASGEPDQLTSELERAGQRLGLQVESVEILYPLQAAPAVTVVTSEPASFVADYARLHAEIFGGRARFEGQFLRVNDEAGRPVLMSSASFRTGIGGLWIRPDLNPRTTNSP